jgi:putative nucleotidyltransferase with HDIG domain
LLLTLLTGVVVAVYQLDEIRSRTKLPTAGAVTSLAVMLAAIAAGFVLDQGLDFVLQHALLSGVVTFAAAGVISLLLPFIERVFNTATSLSMLEWRDPTKPLLQLLAREAPGTYSHCLVLGTLAEAACEKIGANGLLAQVGALYHDVGKIHRPGYFTENQEFASAGTNFRPP